MDEASTASTRTGGQLLVEGLKRWGTEVVFGLPGVQLDWFFDALADDGSIEVVVTRHEQGAAYMADGYARATGRPGVFAVVPGPGVLNAGAALSTAYAANSPVLCITGHVFGGDAMIGRGVLHELPDQTGVLRSVIGRSERVRAPHDVPDAVDRVFAALTGPGRCRPHAIEIGPEVLGGRTDATYGPRPVAEAPKRPDAGAVRAAVDALAGCRRPLVWAGGGALGAGEAVLALADALDAPVVTTYAGRGAVPDRHPRVLPPTAGYTLAPRSDAVVVVGSRFYSTTGPVPLADGAVVVRIDVDAAQLALSPAGAVLVEADAGPGCDDLVAALDAAGARRPVDAVAAAGVAELRTAIRAGLLDGWPDSVAVVDVLRSGLPDDAVLVDDMTQVAYVARNAYEVHGPRTYLGSGYQGTLGSGFATALGAKVGAPGRVVVSLNGDGGFLFASNELATARQHGIAVVAIVFDDGAYGNVRGIQRRTYGREIASSLTNPDFVALAASFGVPGWDVADAAGLRTALAEAIATGGPALIRMPFGPQPDMWAVLGGRTTLA